MRIKKLHLNRKRNSVFAKNLLNFIKGSLDLSPSEDSYFEMKNASNTSTAIVSNAISTHKSIRVSNMHRLVFGHLNSF